jgi:two-component system LytT family sensor kinase
MAFWKRFVDFLFNPYLDPPPSPLMELWFDKFFNGWFSYVALYAAIPTLNYFLDSQKRLAIQQTETARLNEQLMKVQLHALRQQIEPHFLFNTLNAVAGA